MDALLTLWAESGLAALGWRNLVMFAVGGLLIYLAIHKQYEPLLLIPIGFGAILANLPRALMSASDNPAAVAVGQLGIHPLMQMVYDAGVRTEFLPPVIFLGVGALTDFRPLLARPLTFLLGASAQLGVVVAAMGAHHLLGFTAGEAASIGIIGGADGPTTIYLTTILAPHLLGAVAVAAYSYMALVPLIQPPIIRLLTTERERRIAMPQARPVSRVAVIMFPIVTAGLASLLVPACAPLVGMLMYGNLLRESGVTERLTKTAGGHLINVVTMFLALVVGATMEGSTFLQPQTLYILVLGAAAFVFSTAGGVLFAKLMNLALPARLQVNPCIGAAGVSAVPMAARVVQTFVAEATDGEVNLLMPAMGPNVAGVIGTAVAAGAFIALLS